MPPPGPPAQLPPPTFEENSDPNAQAAPRPGPGYVYAYPPYGYPGQVSIGDHVIVEECNLLIMS